MVATKKKAEQESEEGTPDRHTATPEEIEARRDPLPDNGFNPPPEGEQTPQGSLLE